MGYYPRYVAIVLLTGATGMVGREILARLAVDARFDRVLCLIRPPLDRFRPLLIAHGIADASHVTGLPAMWRRRDSASPIRARSTT